MASTRPREPVHPIGEPVDLAVEDEHARARDQGTERAEHRGHRCQPIHHISILCRPHEYRVPRAPALAATRWPAKRRAEGMPSSEEASEKVVATHSGGWKDGGSEETA